MSACPCVSIGHDACLDGHVESLRATWVLEVWEGCAAETTLSRTREQVLEAVGSRSAPASPCDGLSLIEDGDAPSVLIGKPCDIAGAAKAQQTRPRLAEKLGLTIAVFCAGTPNLRGTFEMLSQMGISDPDTWPPFDIAGTDGRATRPQPRRVPTASGTR